MKSEARTWTLHYSDAMTQPSNIHIKGPGVFADGLDGLEVIELEPVLDMLGSWLATDARARSPLSAEAEALLKAHGRLSEEEGKGP